MKHKILLIKCVLIKDHNFLKKHILHNFMNYFPGTLVNQIVNKYLNC